MAWQGGGGRQGRRGSHEARVAAAGVLGDKKSTPLIKVVAGWRAVFLLRGRGVGQIYSVQLRRSEPHICQNARISPTKSLTSVFPPFAYASERAVSGGLARGKGGVWAQIVDGSGGTASGSGQAVRGRGGAARGGCSRSRGE